MKRWFLRICALLILGAIVNVAVAWAAAGIFTVPVSWRTVPAGQHDTDAWNRLVPHDLPSQPVVASSAGNWGAHFRCVGATRIPEHTTVIADDEGVVTRIEQRDISGLNTAFDHAMFACAGWPCSSMSGASWRDDDLARICTASEMLCEAPTYATRLIAATILKNPNSGARSEYRMIPLAPLWPGFAFNTVFYASILWLLLAAPFALRRRRRVKRGLCLKCAYPVSANEVCTECGAAVRVRPERDDGM